MTLNFRPISLSEQAAYRERLQQSATRLSDYSFINLWGWAEEHGLEWAWSDPLVWIRQTRPIPSFWAPVGPTDGIDWKNEFNHHLPVGTRFTRVSGHLAHVWGKIFGNRITVGDAREHWDYLYDTKELVSLSGRRFHKKKNLLNQFKKKYEYRYRQFGPEMIAHALGMQKDWCTWRDCESSQALASENRVIPRVLESWDALSGITGGALFTDKEMVAYTIAEDLLDQTLLIHFEKGNHETKGVYQAINQMFLEHHADDFKWVNREQDLGDPGLRKAKLSYHPIEFIEKFTVTFE